MTISARDLLSITKAEISIEDALKLTKDTAEAYGLSAFDLSATDEHGEPLDARTASSKISDAARQILGMKNFPAPATDEPPEGPNSPTANVFFALALSLDPENFEARHPLVHNIANGIGVNKNINIAHTLAWQAPVMSEYLKPDLKDAWYKLLDALFNLVPDTSANINQFSQASGNTRDKDVKSIQDNARAKVNSGITIQTCVNDIKEISRKLLMEQKLYNAPPAPQ